MKRLPMRKIREVLRLKFEHRLSERKIASGCNISRSTVSDYLGRFAISGLPWPLPDNLNETELEQRLFPVDSQRIRHPQTTPDWSAVHQELRRPGMTLMLLWQEYKTNHPNGYQYKRSKRRFLLQLLVHQVTPTSKLPGLSPCQTGSALMFAPSTILEVYPTLWCRTT